MIKSQTKHWRLVGTLYPLDRFPGREGPYYHEGISIPGDDDIFLGIALQTKDGPTMALQRLPDQSLRVQVPDTDRCISTSADQISTRRVNCIHVVRMALVRMSRMRQLELNKAASFPICF